MKAIWQVGLILAVCAAITFASGFEPFRLERLTKQDTPQAKDDKINRNSEKAERRDRELQAFTNSLFPQWDTATTNASGIDTIYLDTKYATTYYFIGVTGVASAIVNAGPLSDSSFFVTTVAHDGTPLATGYRWQTFGEISTQ